MPAAPASARAALAVVLAFGALAGALPPLAWGDDLDGQSKAQLEEEKLREEVRKLRDDHGTWADVARLAPFITAVIAVVTLAAALRKQIDESAAARKLELQTQREAREAAERESIRRFDEQFASIVANLSSADGATRSGAAAAITTFMKPEHQAFHEQVFLLLLGALRFPRGDVGDKLLARTFQRVARAQIPAMRERDPDLELDLTNCYLRRVNLSGIDLSRADLAFANCHGAVLEGSSGFRLKGYKTDFSEARFTGRNLQEARLAEANLEQANLNETRLISAVLDRVNATGARFQRANLKEAHLEGAILRGASFEEAELQGAIFKGAVFDAKSLRSIARGAKDWREAVFDPPVDEQLEKLSSEDPPKEKRAPGPGKPTPGHPDGEA
ncbi:MAG TPA: pentapeptide repeat-containing protein [Solirubrobacteraceae bacterium]|nr:pentapeptide repeat-containing protein [Solirubrobacteraceae bacterium]